MTEKTIYLDTSAYLEDLCNQSKAHQVRKVVGDGVIKTSVLLLIEAERNLVRMSRAGILSFNEYLKTMDRLKIDAQHFILRPLFAELCLTGTFPPLRIPRANDLVHLRTALWFDQHEGIDFFLTLDESQKAAAKEMGLPVVEL